ncbi:hypothetical protein MAR_016244 [Mya arenaria]|uniref:Uncharacterized protein n=1 Tax=Mya arenaria TaxID=6604 RepID=A0ABY7FJA5_MYAAR|nr:hypothetical protein MAR_016244 [Mya arenaria]
MGRTSYRCKVSASCVHSRQVRGRARARYPRTDGWIDIRFAASQLAAPEIDFLLSSGITDNFDGRDEGHICGVFHIVASVPSGKGCSVHHSVKPLVKGTCAILQGLLAEPTKHPVGEYVRDGLMQAKQAKVD